MDTKVKFPLNRSVSIKINFEEYDNPQKICAFELQRIVIDSKGYHTLSVKVPKDFINRLKDSEKKEEFFQFIDNKTYKVFYNKRKTSVVIKDNGMIKFKGPAKTYKNQVFINKDTFSTILEFIDKDFHRNDEKVYENTDENLDDSPDNEESEEQESDLDIIMLN